MSLSLKTRAADIFLPHEFGAAYLLSGVEKVIHKVRKCLNEHWADESFVLLKVDLYYAVNMVSRQWILNECAVLFPDILP